MELIPELDIGRQGFLLDLLDRWQALGDAEGAVVVNYMFKNVTLANDEDTRQNSASASHVIVVNNGREKYFVHDPASCVVVMNLLEDVFVRLWKEAFAVGCIYLVAIEWV